MHLAHDILLQYNTIYGLCPTKKKVCFFLLRFNRFLIQSLLLGYKILTWWLGESLTVSVLNGLYEEFFHEHVCVCGLDMFVQERFPLSQK